MYFPNYGRPKTWLNNYKKKYPFRLPLDKADGKLARKDCSNLSGGTFIILIDHREGI